MSRLAEHAFKGTEVKEEDDRLTRRMKLLSFLTPEALEIKAELFNETLLAIAADELRKINGFKTPGEKVQCVVSLTAHRVSVIIAFSFNKHIMFAVAGQVCSRHIPVSEPVAGQERLGQKQCAQQRRHVCQQQLKRE